MRVELPAWPLQVLALGYPIMWLLGLGFVSVAVIGATAIYVLWRFRATFLPRNWWLWLIYLVFVLASFIELDTAGRVVGYVSRLTMVLGATAIAVYVYSASVKSLPTRKVYFYLSFLWFFVIIGGWLGVLFPQTVLTTPVSMILPGFLADNEFVSTLTQPPFAEIQEPYGAEEPFYRPAAPLPGANGWGANVVFLAPLMYRYWTCLRGRSRWFFAIASLSAVVPAAATLNRGLILGLTVAGLYGAYRALLRGRIGPLLTFLAAAALVFVVAWSSGVLASLAERLELSGSNDTRSGLYEEAFQRTLESPLLGYGAPRPSYTYDVSVGTQGHLWNVMFSHGFVALACYLAFIITAAWLGRNAPPPADAAHVVVVVGLALVWFYGFDGPQIAVLLIAVALSLRAVEEQHVAFRSKQPHDTG